MRRSSLDKLREDLRLQQVYNTLLRYGYDTVLERTAYFGRVSARDADLGLAPAQGLGRAEPRRQAPAHARGARARPTSRSARSCRVRRPCCRPTWRPSSPSCRTPSRRSRATRCASASSRSWGRRLRSCTRPSSPSRSRRPLPPRSIAPPCTTARPWRSRCSARTSSARSAPTSASCRMRRVSPRAGRRRSGRWTSSACSSSSRPASSRSSTTAARPTTPSASPRTCRACPASTCRSSTRTSRPPGSSRRSSSKGVKVSDVEAIQAAGLDRDLIARNALRALIKQLPVDGFFHADPHPGNLLVDLDTGVLTFIDLGMMGELDLQKRLRLGQLMIVAQQGSVEGMADALRGMSTPFTPDTSTRRPSGATSPAAWGATWGMAVWPRSARSPTRASSCCASTACVWTPTSPWRSRRSCRPRASRGRCRPTAACSRRACRCCATWRSRPSPARRSSTRPSSS